LPATLVANYNLFESQGPVQVFASIPSSPRYWVSCLECLWLVMKDCCWAGRGLHIVCRESYAWLSMCNNFNVLIPSTNGSCIIDAQNALIWSGVLCDSMQTSAAKCWMWRLCWYAASDIIGDASESMNIIRDVQLFLNNLDRRIGDLNYAKA